MTSQRIALIGAGKMATALAGGWLQASVCTAGEIIAADPSTTARETFARTTGCLTTDDNAQAAAQAEIVVLAVKPQQLAVVAASLPLRADQLAISIAAGVSLSRLDTMFPFARLARVMPNTPVLVGRGAGAYALGPRAAPADGETVERLFAAVGRIFAVEEALLDAVTGLSGSGPAFVYILIEALSDGGVRMGLPRTIATQLAAQTVLGAAEMVLHSGEHPAVLKDQVASPGGTTIAGIAALERGAFRAAAIQAVEAAARRSRELSEAG